MFEKHSNKNTNYFNPQPINKQPLNKSKANIFEELGEKYGELGEKIHDHFEPLNKFLFHRNVLEIENIDDDRLIKYYTKPTKTRYDEYGNKEPDFLQPSYVKKEAILLENFNLLMEILRTIDKKTPLLGKDLIDAIFYAEKYIGVQETVCTCPKVYKENEMMLEALREDKYIHNYMSTNRGIEMANLPKSQRLHYIKNNFTLGERIVLGTNRDATLFDTDKPLTWLFGDHNTWEGYRPRKFEDKRFYESGLVYYNTTNESLPHLVMWAAGVDRMDLRKTGNPKFIEYYVQGGAEKQWEYVTNGSK